MKLAALQRDFRDWLVNSDADAAARIGGKADAGLMVYQNNYRSQLVACIEEGFERVHAWLGDEAFLVAAIAHIDDNPPNHWTLDAYPARFISTLAARYPSDPEVKELGWLDHALSRAFAGADAAPLPSDHLATIDWDNAMLRFTPTLAMESVTTNAAAIWSALSADMIPPTVHMLDEPATLLVWRQGPTPCFRTIDARECRMMGHLRNGETFGAVCARLADEMGAEDGVAAAGTMLGQWLRDELIIDCTVDPQTRV